MEFTNILFNQGAVPRPPQAKKPTTNTKKTFSMPEILGAEFTQQGARNLCVRGADSVRVAWAYDDSGKGSFDSGTIEGLGAANDYFFAVSHTIKKTDEDEQAGVDLYAAECFCAGEITALHDENESKEKKQLSGVIVRKGKLRKTSIEACPYDAFGARIKEIIGSIGKNDG